MGVLVLQFSSCPPRPCNGSLTPKGSGEVECEHAKKKFICNRKENKINNFSWGRKEKREVRERQLATKGTQTISVGRGRPDLWEEGISVLY